MPEKREREMPHRANVRYRERSVMLDDHRVVLGEGRDVRQANNYGGIGIGDICAENAPSAIPRVRDGSVH